jgi:hypothetical protein
MPDRSAGGDSARISRTAPGILPSREKSQTVSGQFTPAEIRQTASDQSRTCTPSRSHYLFRLGSAVGRVRRALPLVRSASVVARAVTGRCSARVGLLFANPNYPLPSMEKWRQKLIALEHEVVE